MSDFRYSIRNYRPGDFDSFVRLYAEAERLEPTGRQVSPRVIAEQLNRPHYTPEQDLFIAETGEIIVGYMGITTEPVIGRILLRCWVHPEHRRRGLSKRFLDCAMQRAEELGIKAIHINIMESNETARKVLSALGFESVRHYLELRLDMDKVRWQEIDREALGCRHLLPGEEDQLALIQNRAFADHWGYNPNTVENIIHSMNRVDRSHEGVILAIDGDRITGYCWTVVSGSGRGRIHMIGTDPDYGGQGVGRQVLLAGLVYLKNKGVQVTELTVDSENTVACALYDSIGFEIHGHSLWYEKVIT